ncbi:Uncharacterized protein HZ326_5291 [Fusarium oxysporum f. sp. albedinis]|nr:Uncharacterized protein HZ326_5291 [Fusarium oxysporum f. sp. albedinis]
MHDQRYNQSAPRKIYPKRAKERKMSTNTKRNIPGTLVQPFHLIATGSTEHSPALWITTLAKLYRCL